MRKTNGMPNVHLRMLRSQMEHGFIEMNTRLMAVENALSVIQKQMSVGRKQMSGFSKALGGVQKNMRKQFDHMEYMDSDMQAHNHDKAIHTGMARA